jgi:tetratricopeptide (TPR) repeat protein
MVMANKLRLRKNDSTARSRLKGALPYLAIFLFALAIRLIYLFEIIDHPIISILLGDAESYDVWAQEIVQKGWIGERTFYQAPFYPHFLALIYTIGSRDFILIRLIQALIGSVSCVLLAGAGARFFNQKSGWLAGILLSLYAPALFFDLLIQKAVLGMFFMCLLLFLMSKTLHDQNQRVQPGVWIFVGVVLACFALVRLMIIFFPVTLRNYVVGGEFVLTTSQLGPNFYIGNNKDATGFYRPLIWDHSDWKYERADAQALAEQDLGLELTPNEVSDYWLDKALSDIRENPSGWLKLMGKKWLMTWNATEISDSESIYAHYRFSKLLNALGQISHFGVLLPLAILGICLNWQKRKDFWGIAWLWLCFAASVALFFVFARYRYPMTAVMLLFAAAGVTSLFRHIANKQLTPMAFSVIIALMFASLINWPLVSKSAMEAPTHYNIGYELERRGELAPAKEAYLTSVSIDNTSTLTHNNLGMVAMKQNRPEDALKHFRDAVKTKPDNWDARVNLGIVLSQLGRKGEAVVQYEKVVMNNPDYNPSLYYNIACYYSVEGQVEEGMKWLQGAIDHGYNNWALIKTDPDLQNLRKLPGFSRLTSR